MVIILTLLIGLGVGASVWDYKKWRVEETKYFGVNREDREVINPQAITGRYQNDLAGLRISYPKGWMVKDILKYDAKTRFSLENGKQYLVADLGSGMMMVYIEQLNGSVVDWADKMVNRLALEGVKLSREREYVRREDVTWVILTWNEGSTVRQRVLGGRKQKLVTLDMKVAAQDLKGIEPTWWEMYRSVVIF